MGLGPMPSLRDCYARGCVPLQSYHPFGILLRCWRCCRGWLPINDRRGSDQHGLDDPAFHADAVLDGRDLHPRHAAQFLCLAEHFHDHAVVERGEEFPAGRFAHVRAAAFNGADLGKNGRRFDGDGGRERFCGREDDVTAEQCRRDGESRRGGSARTGRGIRRWRARPQRG